MIGWIRDISEKFSNSMTAPGAEDHFYDEDYPSDDRYEDYYDDADYYDEPEYSPKSRRGPSREKQRPSKVSSFSSRAASVSSSLSTKDNVYTMSSNKHPETVIIHPKSMEDAIDIGSHVRGGRMCIVDMTSVPVADAQRIADYLCGNTHALDGSITRISEDSKIIAVSPPNHRVTPADYRGAGGSGGAPRDIFPRTSERDKRL